MLPGWLCSPHSALSGGRSRGLSEVGRGRLWLLAEFLRHTGEREQQADGGLEFDKE